MACGIGDVKVWILFSYISIKTKMIKQSYSSLQVCTDWDLEPWASVLTQGWRRRWSYWHTEVRLSHFTSQSITGPLHDKWHSPYKPRFPPPALTFRIQTPAIHCNLFRCMIQRSTFVLILCTSIKNSVSLRSLSQFLAQCLAGDKAGSRWLAISGRYYTVSSSNQVFLFPLILVFLMTVQGTS